MMKYSTISPSPILAPYVRFFWVLEGNLPPGESYTHRSMADGCAEIVFHYQSRFNEITKQGHTLSTGLAAISGPAQQYSRFIVDQSFGIFGVYLYPFALSTFFNLPASAITNQLPDLDILFGQEGKDLEEQVMLATDNKQRIDIVTRFLIEKLKHQSKELPPLANAVTTVIKHQGNIRLSKLSSQFYLSERQFERNFKTLTGFTPKLFSRIIRFQHAVSHYGSRQRSLTDLAYDCGYYDQSHFIHDFKEFSGFHPRQYFSGKAEGIEWRE